MISVIMPAFNAEKTIERAVESVRNQSYEDWELIIINDGSTDRTKTIVETVNDSRIKVVTQENAGASAARNVGIRLARREYITFLDADDTLPRDSLRLRASLLDKRPLVDIVHGAVKVFSDDHELRVVEPDLRPGPLLDRLSRLQEDVFVGICYMLRREKISQHLFQEKLSHCEDLIFFLTIAHDECLQYAAVPEVIYEYRRRPNSAMSSLEGLETGYLNLLLLVFQMAKISESNRKYLRLRVARILFLSWIRSGSFRKALQSVYKVIWVRRFAG
jgi:glycosyltransferase involved in cell wall biosynthesis